ncbi:MAG TPA: nuclear transport factor 2 family protein [Hymenobacter sp.]|jgi:ketosteroid isomerase-like protein|uniref:nuclear transport factor 2 family protein n=1 Tax=Hymenobacter sp. TaxID=1898978 RepID=UPI002ED91E82
MLRKALVLSLPLFFATGTAWSQQRSPGKAAATPPPGVAAPPAAPAAAPDELKQKVAQLDAEMFAAFNAKDVDKLTSYFADNLEFYHDKGGLANFTQTKEGFTRLFAQSPDITRTLVPGSLEVYPVQGYGAMHIATQQFCHVENGRDDCGNSKFVMVWQQQGSAWKITRVVSYDH